MKHRSLTPLETEMYRILAGILSDMVEHPRLPNEVFVSKEWKSDIKQVLAKAEVK